MAAARRLILENNLGQKVRAFQVQSNQVHLIYRFDTRRVELQSDLETLNESEIEYQIIETIQVSSLEKQILSLTGLGRLRLASKDEKLDGPAYALAPEQDEQKLKMIMKKTGIGHLIVVVLLVGFSFLMNYLTPKQVEPQLVTIVMPPKETPAPVQHVKVSETKIKPIMQKQAKVADHTVQKPVAKKIVVRHLPVPVKKIQPVVRNTPQKNLERVGALAALGGIKTGAKNAEGLDAKSLKNIRSAGVGQGGGGVGDAGSGGMKGMMAGNGLIAGSAGSGGKAQSAGGYGTKGAGGGKAGYGKISLVGGTSGVDLPAEEAMVEGGLDRDQIAAVINRNKGQIIYCYEQGLQSQPELRGRVSVQFVIGAAGRITIANVAQSSLGSKSVENCMVAKMRTWQFPHPVGNVNVDVLYPFDLRRVSSR